MSDKSCRATVRATIDVQVGCVWSSDTTLAQIEKQARDAAQTLVQRAFEDGGLRRLETVGVWVEPDK